MKKNVNNNYFIIIRIRSSSRLRSIKNIKKCFRRNEQNNDGFTNFNFKWIFSH